MMRPAASTKVTDEPNRQNAWANSQPMGPPPTTASLEGNSSKPQMVS